MMMPSDEGLNRIGALADNAAENGGMVLHSVLSLVETHARAAYPRLCTALAV